jgi:hypothetical protein
MLNSVQHLFMRKIEIPKQVRNDVGIFEMASNNSSRYLCVRSKKYF